MLTHRGGDGNDNDYGGRGTFLSLLDPLIPSFPHPHPLPAGIWHFISISNLISQMEREGAGGTFAHLLQ